MIHQPKAVIYCRVNSPKQLNQKTPPESKLPNNYLKYKPTNYKKVEYQINKRYGIKGGKLPYRT